MRIVLILFALAGITVTGNAQKTYKVNENYEKLMAGSTAYELDFNNDYGFIYTDLAPGSAGSPPLALLVFDKKANTLTKVKFSYNHKKDEIIGSVALDDKITFFYNGKSKTTKKQGLHAQKHKATGELLQSASFLEFEGKENPNYIVRNSSNKKYIAISDSKKVILLDQDLKIVHEKIKLTSAFQDVLVMNDGSLIVESSSDKGVIARLHNPQGEQIKEVGYEFAVNCYSFISKLDESSNKLYVASLSDDGAGKKAKTVSNRLQTIDIPTFKSVSVSNLDVKDEKPVQYSFPKLYCFGDLVYIISQELFDDSKQAIGANRSLSYKEMTGTDPGSQQARDASSKMKNYTKIVSDKMNISSFKGAAAVKNNTITRHVAVDGNFYWMLETNMFAVKGQPMLAFYTLGNVSVGSYNYKFKTARLDESLQLVDAKETDTGDLELNINHLYPMSSGADKFYFIGWKSVGKFGSAELTF